MKTKRPLTKCMQRKIRKEPSTPSPNRQRRRYQSDRWEEQGKKISSLFVRSRSPSRGFSMLFPILTARHLVRTWWVLMHRSQEL